jgi:hypothetical protein
MPTTPCGCKKSSTDRASLAQEQHRVLRRILTVQKELRAGGFRSVDDDKKIKAPILRGVGKYARREIGES